MGHSRKLFLTVLLCMLTVLVMNTIDGYRPDGPAPLTNADFVSDLAGWSASETGVTIQPGSPAALCLENAASEDTAFLSQTIGDPRRFEALRLSVELKTEAVHPGPHPSNRARVVLASYDADGNGLWHHHHILVALAGTQDWRDYSQVFLIGSDVASLNLRLELRKAEGVFQARNLRLEPAAKTIAHRIARYVLMALWAAHLLWIALALVRTLVRRPLGAAVLVLALLILSGTLSPKQYEVALAENIVAAIAPSPSQTVLPPDEPMSSRPDGSTDKSAPDMTAQSSPRAAAGQPFDAFPPGKIAHVLLFALLGLALAAFWRRSGLAALAGTLLLAAIGSEVLQLFAPGRDSALDDASLNAAGALAGMALGRVILRLASHASARPA